MDIQIGIGCVDEQLCYWIAWFLAALTITALIYFAISIYVNYKKMNKERPNPTRKSK